MVMACCGIPTIFRTTQGRWLSKYLFLCQNLAYKIRARPEPMAPIIGPKDSLRQHPQSPPRRKAGSDCGEKRRVLLTEVSMFHLERCTVVADVPVTLSGGTICRLFSPNQ